MIPENFDKILEERIALVSQGAPGSIGDLMAYRVLGWDGEKQEATMTCQTLPWMRNYAGTLHGGLCTTVVDQAMGFVSNALRGGHAVVPTVQLSVNYHRPLDPDKEVLVKVRVESATRRFMTLTAQAWQMDAPEKLCLSATGLYYTTDPGEKKE